MLTVSYTSGVFVWSCHFSTSFLFTLRSALFFLRNPSTPMCVYRPWDLFILVGEISQLTVTYQLDLGFVWFPSFLFSLHILLIYRGLSADGPTRPGGPGGGDGLTVRAAPPPAPRRRRWPSRFGRPRPPGPLCRRPRAPLRAAPAPELGLINPKLELINLPPLANKTPLAVGTLD